MTHWTLYTPGQVLSGGAFKIMSVIRIGATKETTRYLIKYLCCGRKIIIDHRHIDERNTPGYIRKRRHVGRCRSCAYYSGKTAPLKVAPPKLITDEPVTHLMPPWYISPAHAWQRPVGVEPLPVWGMQP